jgi:putative transposase
MTRPIPFVEGEYYHVYNRGTDKRKIFLSPKDHERFLTLMFACNGEVTVNLDEQGNTLQKVQKFERGKPLVAICAFCLMPNHFHFLLRQLEPNGISKFMQKLSTGYTMYFNARQRRSGTLFQGKFKATHADDDIYLRYLVSYIHLNPIKLIEPGWKENGIQDVAAAEKYLLAYRCSSYPDFSGVIRSENILVNADALPHLAFQEKQDYFKRSLKEWLDCRPE